MIPRLTLLTVASAALAVLLLILFQTYFSDILPLASGEATQSTWRFQGAYALTILMYLATAVAFMSALGLIALIATRYLPKRPRNSG
ncbi:hypothetical protein [Tardiphaga sp. P9-11]|uniref:hypothetical protein n=1 Tax=Tardiphaga sp. P9-11 TaxID=2024614 RepID=UPI0011F2A69A|nr:hypothetical protein [Tardiphaga sp. P9-11]